MKVVTTKRSDECGQKFGSLKGICQNPEFASSLLKIFAPAKCANVSSTEEGIPPGKHNDLRVGSPHICGLPHPSWEQPPFRHTMELACLLLR